MFKLFTKKEKVKPFQEKKIDLYIRSNNSIFPETQQPKIIIQSQNKFKI